MGDESEGTGLARFFDLSVDLLCVVGPGGRFKRLNPAWERTLGFSLAELKAQRWTDLVHPDDRQQVRAAAEGAVLGTTARFETRFRCRDGGYRWLQWSTVRVPEEEALYAVARDVTAQKDGEARLRASEAFKAAVLDSALDAIISVDPEGRVVDFNAAAERMFGYWSEHVKGKPVVDLAIPPELREAHLAELASWVSKGRTGILLARAERTGWRADGSRFPAELTVTRPQDGPTLFAGFVRDLTEQKRAEEQRRSLEHQLRQAQKMDAMGRVAGGIAHDFNNLLSVILGSTDIAAGALPADAAAARESLDEVKRAAQRASTLVGQLLAFGRRQVLSIKLIDPNSVILDLERILRGLAGEQIDLLLTLGPDVGPVRADRGQLEQAVVNLAVNARDAMPDGGRLRIATANLDLDAAAIPAGSEAKPGPYVRLSVEDTGKGMTSEVAARVFEPFFTTKPSGDGSGLGLAMVYGIVTQSGGFVRFSTAPGKGTAFELYLPRGEAEATGAPAASAGSADASKHSARPGETVLLVEDEESVRQLLRKILEQRGYKVLLARHGGEALEICRRTEIPIHLLLTDVVMPVLSGPELLRRALAYRPNLKLALMSGYSDRPAITGIPFIAKPFTASDLTRRIREILDSDNGSSNAGR
jgi:PAS domain S-box-containing protein